MRLSEKFQHDFSEKDFYLFDKHYNIVYHEVFDDFHEKWIYIDDKLLYYKNMYGFWTKYIHSQDGKEIYFENSNGYIEKEGESIIKEGEHSHHLNSKDIIKPQH